MEKIYTPRLEAVKVAPNGDITTQNAWQDWGCCENYEDAVMAAKEIKADVDAGKYDNRKSLNERFEVVLEVHDNDSYLLLEIIELFNAA